MAILFTYLRSKIETIEAKKLIRKFRYHRTNRDRHESLHDISYFITKNVLDSILLSDKSLTKRVEKMDVVTFLEKVYSLIATMNCLISQETGRLDLKQNRDDILKQFKKAIFRKSKVSCFSGAGHRF